MIRPTADLTPQHRSRGHQCSRKAGVNLNCAYGGPEHLQMSGEQSGFSATMHVST
jgi:hypothetical protein